MWFGDNQATTRVARACNEYGAKLVQQYPKRFGLFAALPLPDVDATLKEIAYAYDVLKVDGVGLFTSYGDTWLGNAAFRPAMEELNRRKAVVHVHPTAANCCRNLAYGTAPGSIEYGTDTTRAIIGVTFNGDTTRYPDIQFIWSHAGGSAPFLAGRIDGASATAKDRMPAGFMAEAKKFYYDTAGAANRGALASLLELVSPSHILFGTDFPPGGTNLDLAKAVAGLGFFKEDDLRAIERENAVRLHPAPQRVGGLGRYICTYCRLSPHLPRCAGADRVQEPVGPDEDLAVRDRRRAERVLAEIVLREDARTSARPGSRWSRRLRR